MEIASTTAINVIDLINLSKDIAQLNLGYLGISVAILGVLGGVFVYFNIKPLKDDLDEQEKTISNLKEEADKLLDKAKEQSEKTLELFKKDQATESAKLIKEQSDKIKLETEGKITELEKAFLEKVEVTSENKDNKLKELMISEMANRIGILEKNLLSGIKNSKEDLEKKIVEANKQITRLKNETKGIKTDVKELKVYKYEQKGQMGAIIYSIELLKEDIDEKDRYGWRIPERLEGLKANIKDCPLDPGYITQIEEQLARIEPEKKYNVLIKEVRDQYSKK